MIIDTHSHLNFNAFKEDFDKVIKKTLAENIWIINVGTQHETSQKAVEIAKQYKQGVYSAIGLHPIYAAAEFVKTRTDPDEGEFIIKEQDFNKEKYEEIALKSGGKVVAVGEIGLDYYYKPKTTAKLNQFKEKQKKIFLQQLELAKKLNLPAILHCRMAHDDVIEILRLNKLAGGVIHCFTGTVEQAQKYTEMGFYIGFNGIIFKLNLDNVIKEIPLDRILVETDCPYLTPPKEGSKRNEPIFIKYAIQKIADLKNTSFQKIVDQTTQNARKLFKI